MKKIRQLHGLLKRKVIIKVYIPVVMMVISLVVGLVGMALQSYYMAGIGTGAVAALALLGICKYEIKNNGG